MTQLIETANFAELELKLKGKFENIKTPLLIMHQCSVPFGVDLESVYSPLPKFAGGTDPRKHLCMQLEISEDAALRFADLDAICAARSTLPGAWVPLVHKHEERYTIKVRINVEAQRPTAFRVGDGELLTGWGHLGPILSERANLRGMSLQIAICPSYVWSVSGSRGLALTVDQFVTQACVPVARIDHFA
jgi:hypothetical protein